ncbi:MAG: heat-inducible transcriptional repressor HrcA [bacterium]
MAKADFEPRIKVILKAIVENYIQTAEPVGSRTLSKMLDIGVSAATIRNVMAELTEQGFLEQRHTSAGRIPTHRAYRFYVDSAERPVGVPARSRRLIDETLAEWTGGMEKTLEMATKLLAHLTDFAGVVAAPRMNTTQLGVIEFIKISGNRIFVVLITRSNMIYNKVIEVGENLSQEFLNSISQYLNSQFSEQSLAEIRKKVLESLVEEKEQYDQLLAQVVRLGKKAFDFSDERTLYVEGQYNLIKGIDDIVSVQKFLKALEEKIAVLRILDSAMNASGVQVYIGLENQVEDLHEFSMVTANYGSGDHPLGSLGVIGPTRMDYLRVIPIIDYTAKVLSQSFANQ